MVGVSDFCFDQYVITFGWVTGGHLAYKNMFPFICKVLFWNKWRKKTEGEEPASPGLFGKESLRSLGYFSFFLLTFHSLLYIYESL